MTEFMSKKHVMVHTSFVFYVKTNQTRENCGGFVTQHRWAYLPTAFHDFSYNISTDIVKQKMTCTIFSFQ